MLTKKKLKILMYYFDLSITIQIYPTHLFCQPYLKRTANPHAHTYIVAVYTC